MDSLEATELRLGLPGTDSLPHTRGAKRKSTQSEEESKTESSCTNEEIQPPAKSQVVGWPPVRSSFRKNTLKAKKVETTDNGPASFMKVSMDGAPYLRKIDLNFYNGYKELSLALDSMFKCFSAGSEFIIAYEDKDGDWMLVGDVPWEMFTSSCKRLRIMKASEAKGLGSNL